MSFHERSARVPLVAAGPGIAPQTASNAVSHLDLLPTLVDLASNGATVPLGAEDLDGRSLAELLSGGTDDVSETTGEYTAEMTSHPIFMIRRDNLKYVHCDTDPPLLHDLDKDPDERINLADDPAHKAVADNFAHEVACRWDSDRIRAQVLASQRDRRAIVAALDATPGVHSWDHEPPTDAANSYVRNHADVVAASLRSRLHLKEA